MDLYEELRSLTRQYEMGFLNPMEYIIRTAKKVKEIEIKKATEVDPWDYIDVVTVQ